MTFEVLRRASNQSLLPIGAFTVNRCVMCGKRVREQAMKRVGNELFVYNKDVFENAEQGICVLLHQRCKRAWLAAGQPLEGERDGRRVSV